MFVFLAVVLVKMGVAITSVVAMVWERVTFDPGRFGAYRRVWEVLMTKSGLCSVCVYQLLFW